MGEHIGKGKCGNSKEKRLEDKEESHQHREIGKGNCGNGKEWKYVRQKGKEVNKKRKIIDKGRLGRETVETERNGNMLEENYQ